MLFLLLFLIAVPITEFYFIVKVASDVGLWNTIGFIILTGITGFLLIRLEGFNLLVRLQKELVEGRMPQHSLSRSFLTFTGGFLLLIPGFLTDILGFIMIFPLTRIFLIKAFEYSVRHMMKSQRTHFYYHSTFHSSKTKENESNSRNNFYYQPISQPSKTEENSSTVIDIEPESIKVETKE